MDTGQTVQVTSVLSAAADRLLARQHARVVE
jgi:hypothetical protein